MNRFAIKTLLLATALAFWTGCSSNNHARKEITDNSAIKNAPLSPGIGGVRLELSCFLWRDFQPNSPPNGKPLRASVNIRAGNGQNLPAAVQPTKLYLVSGEKIWQGPLRIERASPQIISASASNGPKWDPGTRVDVIVEFMTADSSRHLIRAAQQLIQRTD